MAHIVRYGDGYRYGEIRYGQMVPDHPPSEKRRSSMAVGDPIPHARAPYRDWLQNLNDKIATVTFGLAPGDITGVQGTCAAQIGRIDALTPAEATLQGLQETEANGQATTNQTLRELFADWKRMPGWNDQIAAELQAVRTVADFDPNTYKPEFKLRIVAGEIRLDWKKMGADGVAIYSRLAGQVAWTRIGTDTSSPYIDGRPLAVAGVPETREYMLRGMVKDDEIGLDSDIQRITWGGN